MAADVLMQYAWLGFYRGCWILLTDDEKVPAKSARRWMDRETALSELTGEGWKISEPFPRRQRLGVDSKLWFYGFALTRTEH